ncbi:MAG TPA: 3-methyl-2-oxobutanoate hydroxymethyltransferase [Bacillota bacterium]|jgi:3-methyl-2-oxobutanoate hydroxymethyltransferase|nr:3-methyl-2-oxobutanoate hydroxymethyltransferase [Bacillota bacterium]HOL10649.1 3-methyl-2-oxobutanoate hydroxymethyltransferase [Bacillota bacterium]HPO98052.1 3-methyl-2-oxobutanoate hydroxymethyltransferase [Bacillota bacterium]
MKKTVSSFLEAKAKQEKLTILTAYDFSTAKLIDSCGIDAILVGDSLGMVCLGYENTLSVTMADMIHHTKAVARGVKEALLIADMPFMSYQVSIEEAVRNAGRLVQEANAEAVKLEGGATVVDEIKAIVRAQIPVMGHLGLTPQSINMFGGFKVQGRELEAAKRLIDDAKRIEDAGVFGIVLECIPEALAVKITEAVSIPTIGIGAGAGCDGQVLVYLDMLNLSGFTPKFVKNFADAGSVMKEGITKYVTEVRNGTFPTSEHSFKINAEIIDKLY